MAFVAKLSTAGTWRWAVRGGSTGTIASGHNDRGLAIAVAANGTSYVTGCFYGHTAVFGSTTLTNANPTTDPLYYTTDAFIARLDSAGTWQRAGSCGGPGSDWGTDGDLRLAGTFSSTATFGTTQLTCLSTNILVAKISAAGTWHWVVKSGSVTSLPVGPVEDLSGDITVDAQNNAYVTAGLYSPSATSMFGSFTLTRGPQEGGALALVVLDANGAYTNAVAGGAGTIDGNGLLSTFGSGPGPE